MNTLTTHVSFRLPVTLISELKKLYTGANLTNVVRDILQQHVDAVQNQISFNETMNSTEKYAYQEIDGYGLPQSFYIAPFEEKVIQQINTQDYKEYETFSIIVWKHLKESYPYNQITIGALRAVEKDIEGKPLTSEEKVYSRDASLQKRLKELAPTLRKQVTQSAEYQAYIKAMQYWHLNTETAKQALDAINAVLAVI